MLTNLARGAERGRIAAIDVGSNSIHLLIAELDPDGNLVALETVKDQARLGAAIGSDGCLGADALARATQTLKRMKEIADSHGAPIRAIGTHALREARNGLDFCARAFKKTGVQIEIVSGQEEARLVYLGIQHGLPIHEHSSLIVDIGGGSTEILVGQWGEERFSTSLKLGAVRLTQKYLLGDPIPETELEALTKYVRSRLEPVLTEVARVGFERAICSSGTAKSVKQLALGLQGKALPDSLHGETLSAAEVKLVTDALLAARGMKERKALKHMDPKRADVIVAGNLVLESITRLAGVESWMLSLSGLREGIVIDSLARNGAWLRGDPADIRWRTIRSFGKKLLLDESRAWHVTSLAVSLFDQLKKRHGLPQTWREYLRSSAYLHEAGRFLDYTAHHKHAFYLIRNARLVGFSVRELDLLALVVRYHRKRLPKETDEIYGDLEKDAQRGVDVCSAILRLAVSLDRGRQGKIQEIRSSELPVGKIKLQLHLRGTHDIALEMYQAALEKQHLESVFGAAFELAVGDFR